MVPLDQPVPFSHEHHSNELGIACQYCHQGAEKSPWAPIPPTETCMSCHSQIWTNSPLLEPVRESYRTGIPIKWNKVHDLPDFVYFPHNVHVAKGVPCQHCHGNINQMQITGRSTRCTWPGVWNATALRKSTSGRATRCTISPTT
jgi:hypothetical protein